MKNKRLKKADRRISLTGNFTIYVIVFIAALIFTQALRSKASNIFFGFVFLLPWVMLAYALTARLTLKMQMLSESATVNKNEPYSYEFRLINESVIPYPFIDAMVLLPQKNSVRCGLRTVRMSMSSPKTDYTFRKTVAFRFRGTYEIGVDCLYVYDFFRMFRVKLNISMTEKVYVLPRKLTLDIGRANAVSDSSKKTQKSLNSYEKIEISDIREYHSGDSLKSIHWKLSSKSEEFLVRNYDTGTSKTSYVFCDLSTHFPDTPPEKSVEEPIKKNEQKKSDDKKDASKTDSQTSSDGVTTLGTSEPNVREVADADIDAKARAHAEAHEKRLRRSRAARAAKENRIEIDEVHELHSETVDVFELADDRFYDDMNEYCADGIVELSVAMVLKELRGGSECILTWFDSRSDTGIYSFTLRSLEDFDAIFRLFATSPLCPPSDSVARLSGMMKDTQDAKQIFVTSAIDAASVRELCDMPSVADGAVTGAVEVILFDPEERFAHKNERKLYIEGCRAQLASRGLKLTEGRPD